MLPKSIFKILISEVKEVHNPNCGEDNYFKFEYLFPVFKHCKKYLKTKFLYTVTRENKGTLPHSNLRALFLCSSNFFLNCKTSNSTKKGTN